MIDKIKHFIRSYKGALIAVVLLSVLIGAYYFMQSIQDKTPMESNPVSKVESFYTASKEDITSIFATNSKGEYTFINQDGQWILSENKGIELNQQSVEELAYSLTFFDGTFIKEVSEDLDSFGLKTPYATVSITLKDGNKETFYLGNKTLTGTGYYLYMEGNNRIYEVFVAKGERFILPLGHYRVKELFLLDSSILKSIEISSKQYGDILISAKGEDEDVSLSGWIMTKPYRKDVYNQTLGNLIIDKLYEPILINEYVEEKPQSLMPYGLADPAQTVRFNEGGRITTLYFGNEIGNEVYVKKEGYTTVYKINKEPFDFRTFDPFTFVDKLVYSVKLADLSALQINADDKQYEIVITGENADTIYTINGKQISTSKMRSFYESLSLLGIRGVITETISGRPTITTTYQLKNGTISNVSLIPYKDRFYAASINGKSDFYVHKTDVEGIISRLEELLRNPN